MDILVVTGRLAENVVKSSVKDKADVLVLNIDVAAFITPAIFKKSLPLKKKYRIIFVPGLASGDFSELEKQLNTPIYLGSKHAIDMGTVLSFIDSVSFSKKIPACELLKEKRKEDAISKIHLIEKNSKPIFEIKNVKIGGDSSMKVMGEIVDAAHLGTQELIDKILYYENIGADIIDLGISLDTDIKDVEKCVKTALSVAKLPVSIDTLNPELINTALEYGVDIVLSLNSENINYVYENILKTGAISVVIPDKRDSLKSLFHNIEIAKKLGIEKIIADPILEPIGFGFVESIKRYSLFREKDKTTPLFFGTGNVTELIDADSIGINAILTGIAMELDANILFTPDFSDKTYNSISELKTAANMMLLSKVRQSPPKDLGIDLLVIKEKRRREFGVMPENPIKAKASEKWHVDTKGCFKIEITKDKIIARHKKCVIIGNNAKEILDTIIRQGLFSRSDHLAYLGRELMKAELALKFKRSYSQDDEF